MGFQEPPVYLLLCDEQGWRSSDKFVSQQPQSIRIQKGSLLQVDNYHCFDPQKSVSVTLSVLEKPGAKITALIKYLAPITRAQLQLLKNVESHERRCELYLAGHLDISVGDKVMYSSARNPEPALALVRYIGEVPEMIREGHILGMEVIEPGWCQGGGGRDYFRCEAGRGVFSDLGCVAPVRGSVGRITAMIENNNSNCSSNNNNQLNITLSERKNRVNHRPVPTPNNNLRMIHNDLKGLFTHPQATESDSDARERLRPALLPAPAISRSPSPDLVQLRPSLKTRNNSDSFSWDPNSKRTSSRASGSKKPTVNGSLRNGLSNNLRSVTPGTSSSSSSLAKQDYSCNIFQGCGDSDHRPPVTPPGPDIARDTFVTPSELLLQEDSLTWSQRLEASSRSREEGKVPSDHSDPEENFRPPRSPTPPPEFVTPSNSPQADSQSVALGSMVQLETVTGDKMCGVVRYCGEWPGHTNNGPTHARWCGVELEEEIRGGGHGWVQNRQLFNCAPGKGVFVPFSQVIPDPRFSESLPPPSLGQDFGPLDSPVVPGFCAPHPSVDSVVSICGRNKGIQGHQNSCYLDATLFSMFTFTSVFDSLLYRPRGPGDIARYDEVQSCLKDEIINPLRQNLFVRADKVMKLRTMLDSLSDVKGLTDQEKDPEEFLSSLLTQVLKVEPFLELSSGQTAHNYQLIVEKDPNMTVPTVQDLFDQSFGSSSCRVKFKRTPSVLILQMPRFGRQFKLYDRVLPTQLLDVTDVVISSPRQCVICGVLAEWECPACFGSHDSGLASTAYCSQCLQRTHQHKQRRHHKQEKLEKPPGWSKQPAQPIPRIYMELVAVVCIETSHYVSFVRCGDTPQSPWCFFDSMADRKGEQNGYNIPELTPAADIERLMSEAFAEELKGKPNMPLGEQAKRLVSDAYMCFYQSPDVRMYR